jgi:hypothetical protein
VEIGQPRRLGWRLDRRTGTFKHGAAIVVRGLEAMEDSGHLAIVHDDCGPRNNR